MAYDILIKSGTVIDGTGSQPIFADVGIKGDKISAIGELGNASADLVIDAAGKYVTPGFIDVTNHSDTHLTLFKYPALESLVAQGVTTIIGGSCGASLAPLGSHEAINAIRKWVNPAEMNINWATLEEFFAALEKLDLGTNFGTLVGYGTLRRGVIGDEVRLLNLEEREKVKHLLREGMAQGAFGLSLGLAYDHEKISPTEEIVEISKVAAGNGGIIKMHLRSEGPEILASINEALRICRETGAPVHINHFKAIGRKAWPHFEKALLLIARARDNGLEISFDVSPYRTTGSPLYILIPSWAREGGFTYLFGRMADSQERKKIISTLKETTLHYDKILITAAKHLTVVGHTLAELSEEMAMPPEETLLEVLRANEGRVTIVGRTVSAKNTGRAVEAENSIVVSNGEGYGADMKESGNLTHPRSFGAFPHFWHRYVTDTERLTPAEAIKKITSEPAKILRIPKRGTLLEGFAADIAVFDSQTFKDRSTYQNPFRYPTGMEWVIVNGKVAAENGKPTGARAGKVIIAS